MAQSDKAGEFKEHEYFCKALQDGVMTIKNAITSEG